jgi:hypothetical protein
MHSPQHNKRVRLMIYRETSKESEQAVARDEAILRRTAFLLNTLQTEFLQAIRSGSAIRVTVSEFGTGRRQLVNVPVGDMMTEALLDHYELRLLLTASQKPRDEFAAGFQAYERAAALWYANQQAAGLAEYEVDQENTNV